MKIEVYHPFEVALLEGLSYVSTSSASLHFSVNSGKVFNFFNPLNYRHVTCYANGPPLPKLPLPITGDFESIQNQVFEINDSWNKIYIYLYCSFLPPSKWVPGPSFIPIVDKAWIVYKVDNNDIYANTKNIDPSYIKYQTFKKGLTVPEGIDSQIDTAENKLGNAINYTPIACIEKIEGKWQIDQFLKDNLPITTLFDSSSFELHNTKLYDLSVRDSDVGNTGLTISQMKQKVSEIFGIPTVNILKGYIRADTKLPRPLVESFTYKVDIVNRLGFENIYPVTPLSAPASDGTPSKETEPDPGPNPNPYPTPTGIRIFN
jgi:hypothetical protein